jgi:DNA polymerase elongation subunit (family B)
VCISVGHIRDKHLRIKSFYGHDEKALLEEFADLLNRSYNRKESLLCAHNGKEFDFPYIARRMLLNGIKLPMTLNIAGCKPWDIKHLDTMELWKFGDYKSFTSLALLTTIFGIPSPKDDIQGSQVGAVYWQEGNLERIVNYCQKDVVAIVQLLKRFKGEELIEEENIIVV